MEPAAPNNNSRWARRALLGFAFLAPCLAFYLVHTNLILALAFSETGLVDSRDG